MIPEKQKELARIFSQLHKQGMFILSNIWSPGSALVFEKQGFPAVATTSAGIAYDSGCADGEELPFDTLLATVEKIARRITVPLSVDFERGYGDTVAEVTANARRLLEAGAVGFNLEDGLPDGTLTPLPEQIAKIRALADLKRNLGLDFVINARTCAYWLDVGDETEKLRIAGKRGNAFAEAGADCVFIPGAIDEATVVRLVHDIHAPLNLILNGKFNDFRKLREAGVRRLSIGSSLVRTIYGQQLSLAQQLQAGQVSELLNTPFTYARANQYFRD